MSDAIGSSFAKGRSTHAPDPEDEESPQGFAGQKNRQALSPVDNACLNSKWSGQLAEV